MQYYDDYGGVSGEAMGAEGTPANVSEQGIAGGPLPITITGGGGSSGSDSALGGVAAGAATGAAIGGPWGAVIGGGLGLLGGIMGNKSSARQARAQMEFQERMSSTAHQRQVRDLRAAGLNPILSARAGASSPPGAMGQVANVGSAAAQAAAQGEQADRARYEKANITADTRLKNSNDNLSTAHAALARQQKLTEEERTRQQKADASHSEYQLAQSKVDASMYSSSAGGVLRFVEKLLGQGLGRLIPNISGNRR